MSVLGFVGRAIAGNAFRSSIVLLCALLLGGFSLAATLLIRGSGRSLQVATARLGADIVVVPKGVETKVETALLSGKPTSVWMPEENAEKIRAISDVAAASPQLYLASLNNASCCTVSDMFLIVFDPKTDFTVQPWLQSKLGRPLGLGEAIAGDNVVIPYGEESIKLYGFSLALKGTLAPTGTGLDQTMFVDTATAQEMARVSLTRAQRPLIVPPNSISAVMVKVRAGADPHAVAVRIAEAVPEVTAIESSALFHSVRGQLAGLSRSFLTILITSWLVSMALIGLVFSATASSRRREIGIIRALGGPRRFVVQALLVETALLALGGALAGAALAGVGLYLFKNLIVASWGLPFLFPSPVEVSILVGAELAASLASITVAVLAPTMQISRQEPATALRG